MKQVIRSVLVDKQLFPGKKFIEDERGVSPIVATVLIILISIVLAVLVSDGLQAWISDLFTQFRTNAGNIK